MYVLGHEHIGKHLVAEIGSCFVDGISEPLAGARTCEEGISSVTAKGKGMGMPVDIE